MSHVGDCSQEESKYQQTCLPEGPEGRENEETERRAAPTKGAADPHPEWNRN